MTVFWFLLYAQKERPGGEPYRLCTCLLYTSCTLPFELTIDCPEGADAEFDIRCRALAPTAEPMQDADGEYRALEWGVTISVEGKIYRAYALDCCTDGYSTRYQSACKGRTLQTVELVNPVSYTHLMRSWMVFSSLPAKICCP